MQPSVELCDFKVLIEDARKLREQAQAERDRSAKLRLDVRTQVAISRARRAMFAGIKNGEPDQTRTVDRDDLGEP